MPVLRSAVVSGRVVDRSGMPLADARVDAFHRLVQPADLDLESCDIGEPQRFDSVVTDSSGRFALREVPLFGRLHFTVARAGFAAFDSSERPIDLRPGPAIDAGDLVLERALSASFVVTDREQRPIEGAIVSSFLAVDRATARTDANGRCELARLVAGKHSFFAQAEGYAPGFADPNVVELMGDAATKVFTIELERPTPVTGRVVDATKVPIADAEISAEVEVESQLAPDRGRWVEIARTRSAADGSFTLHALREGSAMLEARAGGFFSSMQRVGSAGWRDPPLELVIDRSRWLEIEVVDRHTGVRVEPDSLFVYGAKRGATMVWIISSLGVPEIATAHAGDRLYRVPWGDLRIDDLVGFGVSAEVAGYRSGDSDLLPFPIVNGQLIRVNVSRGRVVEGTTTPGAEMTLIETYDDGKHGRCALADRAGRFRFERVTLRACSVRARFPGQQPLTVAVPEDVAAKDVVLDLPLASER